MTLRTQVAIVGAGPAGLMLARLLDQAGISSIVLEARERDYVEQRIRAGLLEQSSVDMLEGAGVGERMRREGLVHHGLHLQFAGERHYLRLSDLADGRTIMIYGQTEVVKDLIQRRIDDERPLLFSVSDVTFEGIETASPRVRFVHDGAAEEIECDVIAGCDGFHGVSRAAIEGRLAFFSREYPLAWLGILAAVAPSSDELVYAHHESGFALLTMRSPELSRLYIQCAPEERIEAWSDQAIWEQLQLRLGIDGWELAEGEILEKGITGMRSFVCEPMQHGRLFLAGDAAHIVPPTGAKGLNLALGDVALLARGLIEWYASGDEEALTSYSAACAARVWRAEHFSYWMTSMLHRLGDDPFEERLQISQLRYVVSSEAAARTLAENYVGLAADRYAGSLDGVAARIGPISLPR
ncbi:MAG TPA: 4-hydroxybenzoate 3-monooxygenase [Solirubrobacteraceae bacterium]|jgi:p-hydroxybenzoate 3-monooxygenase|nr:4-hydroxybenzoate 3-monooxygenase [Solirubrobacteraceae bacterium]